MPDIVSDSRAVEPLNALHPPFCQGGIPCEKQQHAPADWEHRGRETTFYVGDQRVSLSLVRNDGMSVGRPYQRGPVELSLRLTEEAFFDSDGNEITVEARFDSNVVNRLRAFLDDYAALQRRYDDPLSDVYDMPSDELPKQHGSTKAQAIWNAIALGEELGRVEEAKKRSPKK